MYVRTSAKTWNVWTKVWRRENINEEPHTSYYILRDSTAATEISCCYTIRNTWPVPVMHLPLHYLQEMCEGICVMCDIENLFYYWVFHFLFIFPSFFVEKRILENREQILKTSATTELLGELLLHTYRYYWTISTNSGNRMDIGQWTKYQHLDLSGLRFVAQPLEWSSSCTLDQ